MALSTQSSGCWAQNRDVRGGVRQAAAEEPDQLEAGALRCLKVGTLSALVEASPGRS